VAGIAVVSFLTNEAGTAGNSASQDIGKRNWGWIQTYGMCLLDFAAGTVITEGYAFGTSAYDGKGGGFPSTGTTLTGANFGVAGFVMDAVTAGLTDVKVFLKGLD